MDSFYILKHLDEEERLELFRDAHSKSFNWWVDKLDCSQSWGRKTIEMKLDEVFNKRVGGACHDVFIHRRDFDGEEYLEIGFSTMRGISHYLWIHVDVNQKEYFIEKYGLEAKL